MKIVYDARPQFEKYPTGISEYTINIIKHMKDLNPNVRFIPFAPTKILNLFLSFSKYPKIDNLIPNADIYFATSPRFWPISNNHKKIVVFHDLAFEKFPEYSTGRDRFWHHLQNPQKEARDAKIIIADSQSTKNDLVKHYRLDPDKIKVVYLGVDSNLKKINDKNKLEKFRHKNNLSKNFMLYLGSLIPRKNIIGLLKLFARYRLTYPTNLKLVLAGNSNKIYLKKIKNYIHKNSLADCVIIKKYIKNNEKIYYYNLAKIFIYLSHYEGFGLPPLEAMACGTPVMASKNSSLLELFRDSALLIDPNQNNVQKLHQILTDNKLRNKYITYGKKLAQKLTWKRCARETFKIISSLG